MNLPPPGRLGWPYSAPALAGLALFGALLAGTVFVRQFATGNARAADAPYTGTDLGGDQAPDFRLTDQQGRSVALGDLRGKVVALTFLDSRCTDTCPLTAAQLRRAAARLGPANADRVAFVAVNINTQANAPGDVAEFTAKNRLEEVPNWHFLTGPPQLLAAVEKRYYAYAERASATEIVHSTGVYVIDAEGREQRYIDLPPNAGLGDLLAEQMDRQLGPFAAPLGPAAPVATMGAADRDVAPDFDLTTFDGGRLSLDTLKGTAVVLNFWASWCPPCRQEMPAFEQASRAYRDRGVTFVGVAVQDRAEDSRAFLRELGITYPTGPDESGEIARRYRVSGLPTTVFITRDGRIARTWAGALNEQQLATFVEEIAR